MSVKETRAPATRPAASRHGAQRPSSHTARSSTGVVWSTSTGPGVPPARASRRRASTSASRSSGRLAPASGPTAAARGTPVSRSIAAFHSTTASPASTTATASPSASMRVRPKGSTRRVSSPLPPLCNNGRVRAALDPSTLVLVGLAVALAIVAYVKDPGLPLVGARNGFSMLTFILPRLVPALVLAGLMQVLVPQEVVSRYFRRAGGLRAILIATVAGVLTPGGPMVSVPFMVALANSGAALPPLVAYMTSWSLFGMQRIIAWEAPLMGWHFVVVRVVPSLAFPVLAGWLVALFYPE